MNTARLGVVLCAHLFFKAQTNYQRDIDISFPVTLQQGKLAHITPWTPSLSRSRWHTDPESPGALQNEGPTGAYHGR